MTKSKKYSGDIAIIGMGSLFPDAKNSKEFWQNILGMKNSVTQIPERYWSVADFYDPDPLAKDKTYSKVAAIAPSLDFNPLEFGIPPKLIEDISTQQLISLLVAKEALIDAGLHGSKQKKFDRTKTGVILAASLGMTGFGLNSRMDKPHIERILKMCHIPDEVIREVGDRLDTIRPEWTENSFPGYLANIVSGRIANRFDFGGTNCVVDAACASSFSALKISMAELRNGDCDIVLTGGANLDCSPTSFLSFSKTPALSKGELSRPFDEKSDGMIMGEGIGMVVLKRLEDAENDNDRIYSVIKNLGSSSDGKSKSIYAPSSAGQVAAIERTYGPVGVDPSKISLIEAHGTGTLAGDSCEIQSLKTAFENSGIDRQKIPLGSVKSQIGHTRMAAGVAGLIKTSMALYHKIQPATINVDQPAEQLGLDESPFYINTETRPWIRAESLGKRMAAISSFGFGGANYHVLLEEYESKNSGNYRIHDIARTVRLGAQSNEQIMVKLESLKEKLANANKHELSKVLNKYSVEPLNASEPRIAIVATSCEDFVEKIEIAKKQISSQTASSWEHPKGIFYRNQSIDASSKVAALFSGQGSQYVGMGKDLAMHFPQALESFNLVDQVRLDRGLSALSEKIFPASSYSEQERNEKQKVLTQTENTQPALAAMSTAAYKILEDLGLSIDMAAGHSFGELSALWAAGAISEESLYSLAISRGQAMAARPKDAADAGSMLAVSLSEDEIQFYLKSYKKLKVANYNSDDQTIIAGCSREIEHLSEQLQSKSLYAKKLPVSAAFHTPFVNFAQKPFAKAVKAINFNPTRFDVYSNASSEKYPQSVKALKKTLSEQMLESVRFKQQIANMYRDGARVFVEFGPKSVLTRLVQKVLDGKDFVAISVNEEKKEDDLSLMKTVAKLSVCGMDLGSDLFDADFNMEIITKKHPLNVELSGIQYVRPEREKIIKEAVTKPWQLPEKIVFKTEQVVEKIDASIIEPSKTLIVKNNIDSKREQRMKNKPKNDDSQSMTIEEILESQAQSNDTHNVFLENQSKHMELMETISKQYSDLLDLSAKNPNLSEQISDYSGMVDMIQANQNVSLKAQLAFLKNSSQLIEAMSGGGMSRSTRDIYETESLKITAKPKKKVATRVVSPEVTAKAEAKNVTVTEKPPLATVEPVVVKTSPKKESNSAAIPAQTQSKANTASSSFDKEALTNRFIQVVSEKTGYPIDMLDIDMDMEADLGIDSIKKVEIFSSLGDDNAADMMPQHADTEDAAEVLEALSTKKTIREIVDFFETLSSKSDKPSIEPTVSIKHEPTVAVTETEMPTTQPSADDRAKLEDKFLSIISEKTGYPKEMLEDDMDMEADLGIDSIKKVEIFVALGDDLPAEMKEENDDAAAFIEGIAEQKTIKEVVDFLFAVAAQKPHVSTNTEDSINLDNEKISRFSVSERSLDVNFNLDQLLLSKKAAIIVTDCNGSLSVDLANKLYAKGHRPVFVKLGRNKASSALNENIVTWTLESFTENSIKSMVESIATREGDLGGLIHVHPKSTNSDYIDERGSVLVKSVFFMAKHLKSHMDRAVKADQFCFITVTSMDGKLGLSGSSMAVEQGGLSGLTKSLKFEWPKAFCKMIDINPSLSVNEKLLVIEQELSDNSQQVIEVGRFNTKERMTIDAKEQSVDASSTDVSKPSSETVFLVTGGARGITADCVVDLASRFKSKFILLGRTKISDNEADWALGLHSEKELRDAALNKLKMSNQRATPVKVNKLVKSVMARREVIKTIEKVEAIGGQSIYISADITDQASLALEIEKAESKLGKINGLIHGAGNLADKKIQDKTDEDYEIVHNTKVVGLVNILAALNNRELDYFIMFSSISGFFGNGGQTDYSLSNEILNKFALSYSYRNPTCFVRSFNWGPWDSGMVSDSIKAIYKKLNIEIIPTQVGTRFLVDELANPQMEPKQILINGSNFHKPLDEINSSLSL